jgi:hypothetical protein
VSLAVNRGKENGAYFCGIANLNPQTSFPLFALCDIFCRAILIAQG